MKQKRKDYIELLEQQVEELQKEVSSLTSKLEECKKNLDIKSLRKESNSAKYKFLEDENFFFDGLVNLITENPDMVKTSMHYQTYESSGSSSESRIKFIKEAFETIIDYCVPDPTKIWMVLMTSMPPNVKDLLQKYNSLPKIRYACLDYYSLFNND